MFVLVAVALVCRSSLQRGRTVGLQVHTREPHGPADERDLEDFGLGNELEVLAKVEEGEDVLQRVSLWKHVVHLQHVQMNTDTRDARRRCRGHNSCMGEVARRWGEMIQQRDGLGDPRRLHGCRCGGHELHRARLT